MPRFFHSFDFTLLDTESFKEDSVREELIVPVLTRLGYSASGQNRIERGISLVHPFVSIGSKSHRVRIIPDYILCVDGVRKCVLDAKRPDAEIQKGANVEQAYSYAIHPDVRVPFYSLCNGRAWILFHISHEKPLFYSQLSEFDESLTTATRFLSPRALKKPQVMRYWPDLGLHLLKMGFGQDDEVTLPLAPVQLIVRVADGKYSLNCGADFGETPYLGSFDFDGHFYEKLLALLDEPIRLRIKQALTNYPYHIQLQVGELLLTVSAKLSAEVRQNADEEYLPLNITELSR